MRFRFFLFWALLGAGTFFAQDPVGKNRCGTRSPSREWEAWFQSKLAEYEKGIASGMARPATITIPVVVHVIHGGEAIGMYPNISQAQVKSQIKVLNDDFAGKGYNSNKLAVTGFSAVGAADTKITFCLAQFDPTGLPLTEPGIDRVDYKVYGWTNPAVPGSPTNFEKLMEGTIKPNTIWDPKSYFNIWVSDCNPSNYLLGYATYPGGSALSDLTEFFGTGQNDGVWIWAKVFGTTGALMAPYNLGRTAVHETGHWLGLWHIGGDATDPAGDCKATDYCHDTPSQKGGNGGGMYGQNYGHPSYPLHVNSCGSPYGDMFMNFMDYCEDAAMYMFTPDQNRRMQTALASGYFRNMLGASSATQCLGLPEVDLLYVPSDCANEVLHLVDTSSGASPRTYSWSISPSNGTSFSPSAVHPNPGITFNVPGNYVVTTVVTNSVGVTTSTLGIHISTCTALSDHQEAHFLQISPNPASDQLVLRTSFTGPAEITLINSVGQTVFKAFVESEGQESMIVNVSHLPEGVYVAAVSQGAEQATKRVVITRQ